MFGIVRAVRNLNKFPILTRFCSSAATSEGSGSDPNEITIKLAKNIVKLTNLKNPAKNFQLKEFQAELRTLIENYEDLSELLTSNDNDIVNDAINEQDDLVNNMESTIEESARLFLNDKYDTKNVHLEIKAGPEGEIAGKFASELVDFYVEYSKSLGFRSEIIEENVIPGYVNGIRVQNVFLTSSALLAIEGILLIFLIYLKIYIFQPRNFKKSRPKNLLNKIDQFGGICFWIFSVYFLNLIFMIDIKNRLAIDLFDFMIFLAC